ncbi:hypothetical protein CFC21_029911 [Triticum aestivum]|uniref:Drought-induced protein 1 n=6 Tax=Triticeae TaxID=147389 RepID=W5BCE8_WHEAT|nr:uncharacterized protein LOC109782332 [Aegilops tauschii subsp. strangulata]XP_037477626.1 uncharacterized protein LOC119354959 [Triticum dicoccoides]XP_037485395.1 uncharacterized protein LOC119364093 [Triticum dicoccoides]XP_044319905.1 uncharacterized protein LOC123041332 [Triticum aestivum]XP_044328196.1 uncharacterized protein LOC123049329 [Triticum aestivum]XP_044453240.1 uncharacterized protein LOC123185428 [Triticum aestivum]XP_044970026.1 uncharacterized protein LOC123430203 [Horde
MVAPIAVASAGLGMLAGVAMANRSMQEGRPAAAVRWPLLQKPRCATCSGTGRVECLCSRWSDGDGSGCRTCAGTRRMPCRSCGGSGTGRRAPVRIATASATPLRPRASTR